MLNRLVCWTIFANTNGVVGKNINHWNFHHGSETNRRPAIITKDQKSRTVGPNLRQSHATHDRAHGMFSNAKMQVSSALSLSFKVPRAVYFVESFPTGTLDKILKNRLREMADAR